MTVVVKVTTWPNADGFAEEVRLTLTLTLPAFTVCVMADEVLLPKLVSPP